MTAIVLFVSTYVTVLALVLQSLNVNRGHFIAAFMTSLAIGAGNFLLLKIVPGDTSTVEAAAYLLGGPLGCITAMWAHPRTIGRQRKSH